MRSTPRAHALVLACMAALALSSIAPFARADDDPRIDEARRVFQQAADAHEAGRHRDALALYEQVRLVVVSPTLLYNIASCHEALGELLLAQRGYGLAIDEARAKDDGEVEREARGRLESLEAEIPHLTLRIASGTEAAEITLDSKPLPIEAAADIRIDPGTHRLVVRSDRHTRVFELALEVPRGALRSVEVDLGPKIPVFDAAPRPSVRVSEPTYVPALIAGATAFVLAGGAVVTGVLGHEHRVRFDSLNEHPSASNRVEREDLRDSGTTLYAANAIFTGTAILAAAAGVYFVLRPPKSASTTRASASLVGPVLSGSF